MHPEEYQKHLETEMLRNLRQDNLITSKLYPDEQYEYPVREQVSGIPVRPFVNWDIAEEDPEQTETGIRFHSYGRRYEQRYYPVKISEEAIQRIKDELAERRRLDDDRWNQIRESLEGDRIRIPPRIQNHPPLSRTYLMHGGGCGGGRTEYIRQEVDLVSSPNPSCQFFNDSAYLRCAVNPEGQCDGCRDYKALS